MRFNPALWYWTVGNKAGVVFSAPAAAYVAPADSGYEAFLAAGNPASTIACDGELAHFFWQRGLLSLARSAGLISLGPVGGIPQNDAVEMLASLGVAITSSGTPALDGTYGCDPKSQANLTTLLAGYAVRGAFPGGGTTFAYPDIAGAAHAMTQPQMAAIAWALEDYRAALISWAAEFAATPTTAPPAATATIA